MLRPTRLPVAVRNPVSLIGIVVATTMAMLFVVLFVLEIRGYVTSPYIGLLVFVAIPAVFVVGLLLIPVGAWRAGRRRRLAPENEPDWPVLDFRNPHQRAAFAAVLLLTIVNLLIVSMAAYGGVRYMESSEFCGEVCHTTMEPQYAAHEGWPHARVPCAGCHVGPGAGALLESKLAGTRQLFQVATGRVAMPIPSPVDSLRPARETCEQCHWPEKFHGDKIRMFREYGGDDANTESVTTMQLHVGGGSRALGGGSGIHWHMNLDNQIEYVATEATRETIPYVRLTGRDGRVREYVVEGTTEAQVAGGTRRQMDCMDCHNRPAHTFYATPERAVDAAIAQGRIPRELALARREAVAAVGSEYGDRTAAFEGIARRLRDFYSGQAGTDARLVARAVAAAQDVWSRNVFPAMNVGWGTYPNHLGHIDAPGCFRCHDDEHKAADGSLIRQDCELCHKIQ
ncbi:MAG: cytochrome C [Acidobacteria bacterium]|nr:cytochrome C [Acidobacteriota bacterium]